MSWWIICINQDPAQNTLPYKCNAHFFGAVRNADVARMVYSHNFVYKSVVIPLHCTRV